MDSYGDLQSDNPFLQLKLFKQIGKIDEYVETFKVLMVQTPPMLEEQDMGRNLDRGSGFQISKLAQIDLGCTTDRMMIGPSGTLLRDDRGLKYITLFGESSHQQPRIKVKVPVLGGVTLASIILWALSRNKRGKKLDQHKLPLTLGGGTQSTCQELMERRNKGLYFKCGQHYSPKKPSDNSPLAVEERGSDEVKDMACHSLDYWVLILGEWVHSKTIKLEGVLLE
ncbi:hypothetical protein CR513_34272, partial [Mucuna pruriens]